MNIHIFPGIGSGGVMVLALSDCRQDYSYDCGLAASYTVADWFRIPRPSAADIGTSVLGTQPDGIISYFRRHLYYRSGPFSVPRLDRCTRRRCPVICLVQSSYFVGHYVVVAGLKHDHVVYQDPLYGIRKSRRRDFLKIWYDYDRGVHYRRLGICFARKAGIIPA